MNDDDAHEMDEIEMHRTMEYDEIDVVEER